MSLKRLGEFGFIEAIRDRFSDIPASGCEGIGDDCALLPAGENESFAVTTDMLVEGVHFLREKIPPYLLGRKSLAVNLSDVAAMGALPVATFLSVALPREIPAEWAHDFVEGYRSLSGEYAVPLLGGDTTSSESTVAISVTAVGRVKNDRIKRRNGACIGDRVFVSGFLGGSARGLLDLLSGNADSPFVREHHDPRPYVREGVWLGGRPEVHAMMDVSDGVASDLPHILKASGAGAELYVEKIPTEVGIELAVTGGEDYKLLLTADAADSDALCREYEKRFGSRLYEIGRIVAGAPSVVWKEEGRTIAPKWKGFTHF